MLEVRTLQRCRHIQFPIPRAKGERITGDRVELLVVGGRGWNWRCGWWRRAFFRGRLVGVIVVMPVMLPWLRELLIEYFLLIGSQDAANLTESIPEQDVALMIELAARLHHLEARVAQDIADAVALGRGEVKVAVHPVDQSGARNV